MRQRKEPVGILEPANSISSFEAGFDIRFTASGHKSGQIPSDESIVLGCISPVLSSARAWKIVTLLSAGHPDAASTWMTYKYII
jgi:hypothetical protein